MLFYTLGTPISVDHVLDLVENKNEINQGPKSGDESDDWFIYMSNKLFLSILISIFQLIIKPNMYIPVLWNDKVKCALSMISRVCSGKKCIGK